MDISMIVGNWKMNTTVAEGVELATDIARSLPHETGVEVVVCPPFVSLTSVQLRIERY